MNSCSSVNETNLNESDTKDGLLSFPFDHIYACHSKSAERRQTLQLDKEVEISTHCVDADDKNLVVSSSPEICELSQRLAIAENQNKKLRELLIYHLDLIQQQNEFMTKRDKLFQTLKQENDTLKYQLTRMDRRVTISQRQSLNALPLVHMPTPAVTSTVVETEPGQIMLNSFTELLLPDNKPDSFIFDSDLNKPKPFSQNSFELPRPSESGISSFFYSNINYKDLTMIDNKPSFIKKEIDSENCETLYSVATNSGNPVIPRIQRSRRKASSSFGSLGRMSKSTTSKTGVSSSRKSFEDNSYDRSFNINKKSKMINTYGKTKSSRRTVEQTNQVGASLSDRLQLIERTPTGEDPYQLGEDDLREQSPIPRFMLQKTNHGKIKICPDTITETNTKVSTRLKLDKYNLPDTYMHPNELASESSKTIIVEEPDLDLIKTEPEIDWGMYNPNKLGDEKSMCDFSYGETRTNVETSILHSVEYQDLFSTDGSVHLQNLNTETEFINTSVKKASNKSRKRTVRATSLIGTNFTSEESEENKKGSDNKRGRQRALSATGLLKKTGTTPILRTKGKAISRGKRSPLPGMVTKAPYHTLVGDPDISWYLGLDPNVKLEDIDFTANNSASTVEVPRWREKPYTSCCTKEGIEDVNDKVFEKRHEKLEAKERRQLRWHMRRIREQRHVERLRQRQRDSWCSGGTSPADVPPPVYTLWPQPLHDLRFIEITDELPITAFGEAVPNLPASDFMLPWVRKFKALKRSKRASTLN